MVIRPLAVALIGTRLYDGTAFVDASILSVATNYDGMNLTLTGTATLASSGAGPENILDFSKLSLGGAAAANYTLQNSSGTVAVQPSPLSIKLDWNSKTYSKTLALSPSAFVVTSPLIGLEKVTAVTQVSAGTVANAPVSGSPYAITATGATGTGGFRESNYQISYTNGLLTIIRLPAVLIGERFYDGTTNALSSIFTVSNAVSGDVVRVISGKGAVTSADVGTNRITSFGSLALGGPDAGNYTLALGSGTVAVKPLPLTFGGGRIYDGTSVIDASLLNIETDYDGTNLVLSGSAILASPSAGSEPVVDFSGLTLSGAAVTNYTLNGAAGTAAIAPLTAVLRGERPYDGAADAAGAILSVSNALLGDDVEFDGSGGLSSAAVGTNDITSLGTLVLRGAAGGNYTLSGAHGSVIVNPLTVNLTGTRLYDGTAAINADLLDIETNYDGTNLIVTGSGMLDSPNAGVDAIVDFSGFALKGSAATNYTLVGSSGTVSVQPAPLTITLGSAGKTYGQTLALDPTNFVVASPLIGSEIVTNVILTSAGMAANAPVSGSPYSITATGAAGINGFQSGNYQIDYIGGVLTVTPLSVVIGGERTYDSTTNVYSSSLIVSNALFGDSVYFTNGNVGLVSAFIGTNAITSLRALALDGLAAGNYTLNGAGGGVAITPLALTLYGSLPYDGTAAVDASLLNIETNYDGTNLTLVGVGILESNLAGVENMIDFSNITLNGSAATNYTLDGAIGLVVVAPLVATLTGQRFYDGTTVADSAILALSNALPGDVVQLSGSGNLVSANVGTNTLASLGTLSLIGPAAANYLLDGANGSVIVRPLPVTFTGARLYDGSTHIGASLLSLQTNYDGTNLTFAGEASLVGSAAGAEEIIDFSALVLGGSASANYTLDGASGTVVVQPVPLSIALASVSKTYGQSVSLDPNTFTVTGSLVGSETVTAVAPVSLGTVANAPISGSPYAITSSGAVGADGFDAANYEITVTPGALTVGALTAILSGERAYDSTTNADASVVVVSNVVPGDDIHFANGSGGLASANIGTNTITSLGDLALGGASAANYSLTGAGGAIIIHPLPLALSGTRPYDGTDVIDASLLTIETNYDGTNLTLSGSATLDSSAAGLEAIADFSGLTLVGLEATNYTLDGATGAALIQPLLLTITLGSSSKIYGQTPTLDPLAFTVTSPLFGAEGVTAVMPISDGTAANAPVSGSPYEITAIGATGTNGFEAGNYQITYSPGFLTIAPLPVVLGGERSYDNTTNADSSAVRVSNAVPGDDLEFTGSGGLAAPYVGTNFITSLGTLALGGSSAGNYVISAASGALIINPLAVTLSGTRSYDGAALVAASSLAIETNYDGTNLGLSGAAVLESTAAGLENIADFSQLFLTGPAATNYTLHGATGAVLVTNPELPFTTTSASVDVSGGIFTVCWESIPGVAYDVLTNSLPGPLQSWGVLEAAIIATDTNDCFAFPMDPASGGATLVLIRQSATDAASFVQRRPRP
jgi:hypothetical protein